MSKTKKKSQQVRTTREVNVAGRLTVWGASDLKDLLTAEIEEGGDIVLQMAETDEMDIAGLQVLLAAQKSARANSAGIHFPKVLPTPIREWMKRAGVTVDAGN